MSFWGKQVEKLFSLRQLRIGKRSRIKTFSLRFMLLCINLIYLWCSSDHDLLEHTTVASSLSLRIPRKSSNKSKKCHNPPSNKGTEQISPLPFVPSLSTSPYKSQLDLFLCRFSRLSSQGKAKKKSSFNWIFHRAFPFLLYMCDTVGSWGFHQCLLWANKFIFMSTRPRFRRASIKQLKKLFFPFNPPWRLYDWGATMRDWGGAWVAGNRDGNCVFVY